MGERRFLITVQDHKLHIKENVGNNGLRLHSGYSNSIYFSLNIANSKRETIYKKEWLGKSWITYKGLDTYDVSEVSTVMMYLAERTGSSFSTNDNTELKLKAG